MFFIVFEIPLLLVSYYIISIIYQLGFSLLNALKIIRPVFLFVDFISFDFLSYAMIFYTAYYLNIALFLFFVLTKKVKFHIEIAIKLIVYAIIYYYLHLDYTGWLDLYEVFYQAYLVVFIMFAVAQILWQIADHVLLRKYKYTRSTQLSKPIE